MTASIDPATAAVECGRLCDGWISAGLIRPADRTELVEVLRQIPPGQMVRSISDALARRVLQGAWQRPMELKAAVSPPEPVRYSLFEEFLAAQELSALTAYALENEPSFQTSQVISHTGNHGKTDFNHRRSRVLFDAGPRSAGTISRRRHRRLGTRSDPVSRS